MGRIQPESWMANGHIDSKMTQVGSDPIADWILAVNSRQTILGFEDWRQKARVENSVDVTTKD